ncbi:MAG TPA: porphobilinogen synthase [Nitrososphaera sp.]|nr:porphobilinogen synthase [Nitrososphaera sp.]
MQKFRHHEAEQDYVQAFAEVGLRKSHLVLPVFVSEQRGPIKSMPGISVTGLQGVLQHVESIVGAGISSIILFGIPRNRNADGSAAADKEGIVQRAAREVKSGFGNSVSIVTDVCICQYNFSGHCGLVRGGKVDNDLTLRTLAEIASSHAEAGVDIVAPSSMMDGQVQAIKKALKDQGLTAKILSYSAKHASSLYAPFRSAAFARPSLRLDKSSYQISYANPREVLREVEGDIKEGADMVMIKPALAYLDLVTMTKDHFDIPVAVQSVSGEYAMIKAAAMKGWINEDDWKVLTIASIRRAGADRIISYFSLDVAAYL